MASRSLDDLIPEMRPLAEQHLAVLNTQLFLDTGYKWMVTCTARLYSEQIALFAQGRQSLAEVNKLRLQAKIEAQRLGHKLWLEPISSNENKYIVTKTMASKHIINLHDSDAWNDKARAYDVALVKNGKLIYDLKVSVNKNSIPDYKEMGTLAETIGLHSGGFFSGTFKDWPHVQFGK